MAAADGKFQRHIARATVDLRADHRQHSPAADRSGRADRRGVGRERRGLSGTVPQPAGGPLPDRRGLRGGAGRSHRHEHPVAVFVLGADGHPNGGFHRRATDRLHRLLTGARGAYRPDHQLDPGRRGLRLLCHRADVVPHAALLGRGAPRARLAIGRREPVRLDARAGNSPLSDHRPWHPAVERTRAQPAAIWRRTGAPARTAGEPRQDDHFGGGLAGYGSRGGVCRHHRLRRPDRAARDAHVVRRRLPPVAPA